MSLETLLEAAEFLEWSKAKTGKRTTSRETRTSKRAEKFQPYVLSERKKLQSKSPNSKPRNQKSSVSSPSSDVLKADSFPQVVSENGDETSLTDIKKCLGTRETHNKLEKNRRAHLKECFDDLREELPYTDERRTSNLATLRTTLRYIEQLANQQKELENERRRMQRLKNSRQAQLTSLRKELKDAAVEYNLEDWLVKAKSTNSTSTASECGAPNLNPPREEKQEPSGTECVETAGGAQVSFTATTPINSAKPSTDNVQLVIKALPPLRTKPHLVKPAADNTVTVEGSPQAIQLIHQAAVKASNQQRLQLQIASPNIAAPRSQAPAPVLVKVPSSAATATQKILFAPRVSEPQQMQVGQVILSSSNLVVSPAQAAPISTGSVAPLTVNLQTGKVITPRPANFTAPTAVVSKSDSNLAIAPKQIVLISTSADQRVKAAPVATVTSSPINPVTVGAQIRPQINTIKPVVSVSNVVPLTALAGIQPAVKPTIITGMLPTTAADGTVSYVPVTLTTKPVPTANPTTPPQLVGGNLTFVLPTVSAANMQNVRLSAPIAPHETPGTVLKQTVSETQNAQ